MTAITTWTFRKAMGMPDRQGDRTRRDARNFLDVNVGGAHGSSVPELACVQKQRARSRPDGTRVFLSRDLLSYPQTRICLSQTAMPRRDGTTRCGWQFPPEPEGGSVRNSLCGSRRLQSRNYCFCHVLDERSVVLSARVRNLSLEGGQWLRKALRSMVCLIPAWLGGPV